MLHLQELVQFSVFIKYVVSLSQGAISLGIKLLWSILLYVGFLSLIERELLILADMAMLGENATDIDGVPSLTSYEFRLQLDVDELREKGIFLYIMSKTYGQMLDEAWRYLHLGLGLGVLADHNDIEIMIDLDAIAEDDLIEELF